MSWLLIEGAGAVYLVWIGVIMKAEGGLFSSFLFKLWPTSLGILTGFAVTARIMGWPL